MRLDLSELNPDQRRAVTAENRPLLVLAGAGSGKTKVITYRIAYLIQSGVPSDAVVGITFTNKAAKEMRDRLRAMYPDLKPFPLLSTFHALGLRILRAEARALDYRPRFPIYDEGETRGILLEEVRSFIGLSEAEKNLDHLRRQISRWKNRFITPDAAVDDADDDETYMQARIYQRYQARLAGLNAVDFDDLIYLPTRLLTIDDGLRSKWTRKFQALLIDEYQDSNSAQFQFARLLAGREERITVVGDDDQSIYAFRGAEVERILSFERDFPHATRVTLDQNYRSLGYILEAANAVIGHNSKRHQKRLEPVRPGTGKVTLFVYPDEQTEAEDVVSRCIQAARRGVPYHEQAILIRSAIQARPFEEKLRFFDVPYTVVGTRSFFDRREVRDLLAYLRVLVIPEDDIATLRILNVPRRGWGTGSREKLDQFARDNRISVSAALNRLDEIPGISGSARAGSTALLTVLEAGRSKLEASASAALRYVASEIDYDQALSEVSKDIHELDFRRQGVEAFMKTVERFEERHGSEKIDTFLQNLLIDRDASDGDQSGKLTLLTFHGAKGLEFRRAVLAGIEDELIPHRRAVQEGGELAIDEERRLFYVALTRARDELILTRALTRRKFGRTLETLPSRFLAEIPEELVVTKQVENGDDEPVDADTAADYLAQLRAKFE